MTTNNTGAVFFLGTRAHYQVLEQPSNYDAENGNASTETIYQNQSIEELWPSDNTHSYDRNYNPERVNWGYCEQSENGFNRSKSENCVKRRVKRRSSEALLCDDVRPAALNIVEDKTELKPKPRRISLLSFLTSLARRKRPTEQVQYLQHIESVLNNCTYRESCRCLDCQSRYFECDEESDGYSSDDDYSRYSIKEVESQVPEELDDEVFVDTPENDNKSTDLLLDEGIQEEPVEEAIDTDREDDQQLQVEVAASTTAMFNLLLYHPFSCSIQ